MRALESKQANREKAEGERVAPLSRAARLKPVPWPRLEAIARLPLYAEQLFTSGRAVAFTLNPGPKTLGAARRDKAGVFVHLRRRVTRALTKALIASPQMIVCYDEARGHPHLHGFVVWPETLESVRDALKLAAGKWGHVRGSQHQIHVRDDQRLLIGETSSQPREPLTSGWLGYSVKSLDPAHQSHLRGATNHRTIYASPEIVDAAREAYSLKRSTPKPSIKSVNTDLLKANASKYTIDISKSATHKARLKTTGVTNAFRNHHTRRLRRASARHGRIRVRGGWVDRREAPRCRGDPLHAGLRPDREGRSGARI